MEAIGIARQVVQLIVFAVIEIGMALQSFKRKAKTSAEHGVHNCQCAIEKVKRTAKSSVRLQRPPSEHVDLHEATIRSRYR